MSQTFNLSKFNNTREAINVYYPTSKPVSEEYTPLPVIPFPDLVKEVLGVDVDQIDSNIVRELADHYVRSLPSPEAIGPAFESVKSILVDPNPTRRMEQLSAAIELLKKDKNLADLFQIVKSEIGDKGLEILKQKAFAQFGFDYKPEYVEIFKQRVNPKTIESLAKIYQEKTSAGDDASEIKMVAAQLRQDYTSAASEMYNDFVDKCRGLGLNDQQIYWVMTHGKSADPQKLPLSDPPISPDVVKELLNDNNTIVTRISQFFSENAASLFSENVEAMKKQGMSQDSIDTMLRIAKEVGGSIGRDEYLASVNLSRIEVPDDPRDLLDDTIDPDSDLPREVQMRLNPQNLNIVRALLEKGGYVINGKTYKKLPRFIGELKSTFGFEGDEAWQQVQSLYGEGKTLSDDSAAFPTGNYVDTSLWYIASTLCGSVENFRSMVKLSGAIYENSEDGQEEVDEEGNPITKEQFDPDAQMTKLFGKPDLIDERYKDFNLVHDTADQKKAVEMIRNLFGLEVVPSEMGIPALDDCNINVEGFLIDFVVVCAALKNWEPKNDGFHPSIAEQVNFIGEYYGFNFDFKKSLQFFDESGKLLDRAIDTETGKPKDITRVQDPRGIIMPDGSMAKVKLRRNPGDANKDKAEFDATYGTPIDTGSSYKIRTAWKKMTEDFVASITGNAAIHVPPDFTEKNIQDELDKCNIIYKKSGRTMENSPLMLVEQHAAQCNDPQCDSKKTTTTGELHYFKQYNLKEALVVSKIVELKTNALVKNLRSEKLKTASAKESFIQKLAQERNVNPAELWQFISYKEFLDRFNAEHSLDVKGYGRHEVYEYYSQKVLLEEELFELRKSSEYSFERENAIRQKLHDLKEKHLTYFQNIFDSNLTNEDSESQLFQQKLKELEDLRTLVASGTDGYSNKELQQVLDSIVQAYKPHVEAQRKQKAFTHINLFKIAIKS